MAQKNNDGGLGIGDFMADISDKGMNGIKETGKLLTGTLSGLFGSEVKTTYVPSTKEELSQYESGTHWNVDVDGVRPVVKSEKGVAAVEPQTVHDMFKQAVAKAGSKPALHWEKPGTEGFKTWTWNEYYQECRRFGRALIKQGFKAHDAVNVIGFNSPEWFFANTGVIFAGGKSAGIYTTNGPDACKYITDHSEASVVVVENEAQLAKFIEVWGDLPKVKHLVVYRPTTEVSKETDHGRVWTWDEFVATADDVPEADLDARIAEQKPGQCCLLIYTSGTTGPPKAVMISHDNIVFTGHTFLERLGNDMGAQVEVCVSYLPLSHIAAQMADIFIPMVCTALRDNHSEVFFARPDALKGTLGQTLKAARPTWFFGVPRVWEKMMESIKKIGAEASDTKKAISAWAKEQGSAYWKNHEVGGNGRTPPGYVLAKPVVFSKVRQALGLDRCRLQYTGAAPMALEVFEFFRSLDVPVLELYGMSECTGPHTVSFSGGYLQGSTGQALAGTETRIDHVEGRDKPGEGEICYRGRHVMMGYMKQPDKTRETIDPEGFLHSGDVGRVDENGFLFITGRIKELIITAGGENIAPVPIENAVKEECPGLSNVMMVGDRRKYNVMLVTLKAGVNPDTGRSTDELAGEALTVSDAKTVTAAREDPKWKEYIQNGINAYNTKHAVSQAQKIQKFAILPEDFTIADELTPTMKLKRDVTAKKYTEVIEKLYAE